MYANSNKGKFESLENYVEFIFGTTIDLSLPTRVCAKNFSYNGETRRHSIKYRAITGTIPLKT